MLLLLFLGAATNNFLGSNACTDCFNIDFDNAIWLKPDNASKTTNHIPAPEHQSFFGFSLALGENTIYIGAPGYGGYGALFQCPILPDNSNQTLLCHKTELKRTSSK